MLPVNPSIDPHFHIFTLQGPAESLKLLASVAAEAASKRLSSAGTNRVPVTDLDLTS